MSSAGRTAMNPREKGVESGRNRDPSKNDPSVTYFEDRGGVFDAPLEVVWDYIEKDEEFHPKAHRTSLRDFQGKDLSEISSLNSCEVQWGGRWRRMVSRNTTVRPAVRINEELEGPYAGSKMVFLYSPRGQKTAVDVLCYMRSSELTPEEIRRDTLTNLAKTFDEDAPFVRRFARQRSALPTPPS